jgi:hypothetical protein
MMVSHSAPHPNPGRISSNYPLLFFSFSIEVFFISHVYIWQKLNWLKMLLIKSIFNVWYLKYIVLYYDDEVRISSRYACRSVSGSEKFNWTDDDLNKSKLKKNNDFYGLDKKTEPKQCGFVRFSDSIFKNQWKLNQ